MKEFNFSVGENFNSIKTVDYLKRLGFSKEVIQKIKFGGVFVNGEQITNINCPLNPLDKIKILLPPDQFNPYIQPKKENLDIIYEDEYMLAVVKKKGMLTHSSRRNSALSLDQLVTGYFAPSPFTFRAINRLDRDTSGIILIAKDMITASFLGEKMKRGEIKKTYSAIVCGMPKTKHFFIEEPIKRISPDSMKRQCSPDGKYAKSECRFIKQIQGDLSIVEVTLHTGRTHQIRVHLSHIGLPLYADSLYGEKVEGKTYQLCAKRLEFTHPFTKKHIVLEIKNN